MTETTTDTVRASGRARWRALHLPSLREALGLIIVYAAIFLILTATSNNFLTVQNLRNMLLATSIMGIVAIFTTMLMVGGGLDLSVGSTIALSGVVIAILQEPLGIWPAAAAGLLAGGLVGVLNGVMVTGIGINPVIATLGMLYVARGMALVLADGLTIPVFHESFAELGSARLAGIPLPVLIFFLLLIVGMIVMQYTTYGRSLYAIGGNERASFLAALPVSRQRFIAYTLSGLSAGLAGVILTARLLASAPTAATGMEFSVIAAVVLGGTSLAGGKGTLLGTLLGVLILGTLNNGMTLMSLPSDAQQVVQGAVLLLAIAIDQFRLGNIDIAVLRRG
ncbi:MAG TPA: ABC transporter permease [Candidatus Sulfomarinibacteraceae bacterium]|nr:ABC transporter permease [Candidatus Sulfomarinibacteraceae bacterium]